MTPLPKIHSSTLASILTALAVALALWILVTTANIARTGWVAVPVGDDWDRWITYVSDPLPYWYFREHVDHRLVAPKMLFEVDHFVFHARGWFTLLCSFCLQALTGIMLSSLSANVCPQDRRERLVLASVIAACLFSAQQWVNFVQPFQVQFLLLYCAATAALLSLWKAAQQDWHATWIAVCIAAGIVATYSMANGVLLWPVLLLAAFWLRMPRRSMVPMATAAVLAGASFFYHWHRSIAPVVLPPAQRWPRVAIFLLAHLGSPMTPLAYRLHTYNQSLVAAAIPGALLGLAVLAGFIMLWRRRESYNSARAMLIFYCAYLTGSSAAMAYGRADGAMIDAFTPRYLTPSYLLWVCMLLATWPWLRQLPRVLLYAALCAAMFVGIAIYQQRMWNGIRDWASTILLGETAVADNVTDVTAWTPLYHTPSIAMAAVDYLRNNHLSLFLAEWTHWPGIPLDRRFFVDHNPDACQGQFEDATMVPSPLKPGWRVSGWAWDVKAGRPPRYVILAGGGQVAGVALTGFPQPAELAALRQQYLGSPWNGYVDGHPRPITAYVVEADERSLCAIGMLQLPRASREVTFSQLGALFPDAGPEITGVFSPDGYYKGHDGPGAPPTEGRVFGSFPDAGTGTILLGPFHLDGHTEMAIPVITGPNNANLSIVVRDAASKQVLAKMKPPPVRITWWAWRPDLPLDRELTVEIFAEDQGSGWGQWLALGWPHVLKK